MKLLGPLVACPFDVPKLQWDKWNPKIVKWVFNRQKLHVVMRSARVRFPILRDRPDRSRL